MILIHDRHLFLSPFHHTLYKTTLTFNQCHLNLLLMHFFSSYQYILFPCLEFYPLLLKCKTLLQFYVSTSCTDY